MQPRQKIYVLMKKRKRKKTKTVSDKVTLTSVILDFTCILCSDEVTFLLFKLGKKSQARTTEEEKETNMTSERMIHDVLFTIVID